MKTNISFMQRMLLLVVGLVCVVNICAYDFKAVNEDGVIIYYNISGNNVTVTSGDENYTGIVKIPATVMNDGISNNVAAIGERAFYYCLTLESIEIPNSVIAIEEDAFFQCKKLTKIVSLIQEPFKVDGNVFSYIPNNAVLYVLSGTKEAYENVVGWSFSEIVKKYEKVSFVNNAMRKSVLHTNVSHQ